ncbi:MAG: polyprenyl diphosphate synthase [Proteobacteria bacterium]|nr:polyprenyl diphosphate synthase [Pseudomonadota bacterium]
MSDLEWIVARSSAVPDLKLPRHVAVIMDGNGRFARRHARARTWGHRQGAKALKRILEAMHALSIPYLTVFGFSMENWHRPKEEVASLMHLLVHYLKSESLQLKERNVQLRVIGRLDLLPDFVREELEKTLKLLIGCDGMQLTLALSYGARDEITLAAQALARAAKAGDIDPESIEPEDIERLLGTCGMPDPDLLIRTSGEKRLSNFMLWQLAYTEFYFSSVCWPEFDARFLWKALLSYHKRQRRFGCVQKHLCDPLVVMSPEETITPPTQGYMGVDMIVENSRNITSGIETS